MYVMGVNSWKIDIPKEVLISQAMMFVKDVKSRGIAEFLEAWIAHDQRLLWCTWETDSFEELEAAFKELNERSGLSSELKIVERVE